MPPLANLADRGPFLRTRRPYLLPGNPRIHPGYEAQDPLSRVPQMLVAREESPLYLSYVSGCHPSHGIPYLQVGPRKPRLLRNERTRPTFNTSARLLETPQTRAPTKLNRGPRAKLDGTSLLRALSSLPGELGQIASPRGQCSLSTRLVPRYLVRHYSRCFCEGIFFR